MPSVTGAETLELLPLSEPLKLIVLDNTNLFERGFSAWQEAVAGATEGGPPTFAPTIPPDPEDLRTVRFAWPRSMLRYRRVVAEGTDGASVQEEFARLGFSVTRQGLLIPAKDTVVSGGHVVTGLRPADVLRLLGTLRVVPTIQDGLVTGEDRSDRNDAGFGRTALTVPKRDPLWRPVTLEAGREAYQTRFAADFVLPDGPRQ